MGRRGRSTIAGRRRWPRRRARADGGSFGEKACLVPEPGSWRDPPRPECVALRQLDHELLELRVFGDERLENRSDRGLVDAAPIDAERIPQPLRDEARLHGAARRELGGELDRAFEGPVEIRVRPGEPTRCVDRQAVVGRTSLAYRVVVLEREPDPVDRLVTRLATSLLVL